MNRSKRVLIVALLCMSADVMYGMQSSTSASHKHSGGCCEPSKPSLKAKKAETWTDFAKENILWAPIKFIMMEQGAVLIKYCASKGWSRVSGSNNKPAKSSCCSAKPMTDDERLTSMGILLQAYSLKAADLGHESRRLKDQLAQAEEGSGHHKHLYAVAAATDTELAATMKKRDEYLAHYEKLVAHQQHSPHKH